MGVEPGFVASQFSNFYSNVLYNPKMTTLHDRTTVQINTRTYRTEKDTNNQYKNTFRHYSSDQTYQE